MDTKEWTEHGQRFRFVGSYIRSLKPAKLRVAYGDERLREMREARANSQTTHTNNRIRRFLSRVLTRAESISH